MSISFDTEYTLKDGHRMAVTASDLNEQFRKVHKCSLKIYLGKKKKLMLNKELEEINSC